MESTRRGVVSDHPQARRSLYCVVVIATVCIQLLMLTFVGSCEGREFKQAAGGSFEKEIKLEAYTDNSTNTPMHGPAVKSFQVSDGSWVDCVPIEQQIAAHHPALKDHIIRMETSASSLLNLPKSRRESDLHPQCFGREYGGCPEGSIPVQRMSTDPNNPQQKKHRRKQQSPRSRTKHSNTTDPADPSAGLPHQYAVVEGAPTLSGGYLGGGATFSVNGPVIADPSYEFSLSQLWIVAGIDSSNINTAEVGWQVFPSLHPSDKPRAPHLFVYWTSDDYQNTGCYNLGCSGFVQIDKTWVLGGAFSPYTTLAEHSKVEYEVTIYVVFDPKIPGWVLVIDNTVVGYWPSNIYNTLRTGADSVQFGGEIAPATIPTDTAMGSGAFASKGYPTAAYQRNVFYFDSAGNAFDADILVWAVTNPDCYTLLIEEKAPRKGWASFFFFGGPGGRNPACVS
jgi:hypothetical protein